MDTLTEGASQEKTGLSLVGDMEVGESSQQCSRLGKHEEPGAQNLGRSWTALSLFFPPQKPDQAGSRMPGVEM